MGNTAPLFVNDYMAPGMGTAVETFENEFLYANYPNHIARSELLLATATDSGNTPNTSLMRRGLLMSKNRNTGIWAPWTPYTPNATLNNYLQSIDGILDSTIDLTGGDNRLVPITTMARVKANRLIVAGSSTVGLDASPYRFLAARSLSKWLELDNLDYWIHDNVVYVSDDTEGAFDLLDYPNGSTFIFTGANAVALTLPAPLPGLQYSFHSYGTADIVLTGATAGDIVSTTAADDTITLTEIGAGVTIRGITTASTPTHKWITTNIVPTAATNRVTVAT